MRLESSLPSHYSTVASPSEVEGVEVLRRSNRIAESVAASVAITLDTYSHMLPGMGGEGTTAMEDALSQGASTVMPT